MSRVTAWGSFCIALANVLILCALDEWVPGLHWVTGAVALAALGVTWIFVCDSMEDDSE